MQNEITRYGTLLSDINRLPKELKKRNFILYTLGINLLILFTIYLFALAICQYNIYELCHWLKPGKFTLSFALYAFTIGWFLYYLKNTLSETTLRILSWMIAATIVLELFVIFAQTTTETTFYSLLNVPASTTQGLQRVLYILGNILILSNTAITTYIAVQFFKPLPVQPEIYLTSIRVSFIVFLLSCLLGILMVLHYGQTDLDGNSLGLPFTQITTLRSNLISIHFLGIHIMQILPFVTYYLHNYIGRKFLGSVLSLYAIVCASLISKLL